MVILRDVILIIAICFADCTMGFITIFDHHLGEDVSFTCGKASNKHLLSFER